MSQLTNAKRISMSFGFKEIYKRLCFLLPVVMVRELHKSGLFLVQFPREVFSLVSDKFIFLPLFFFQLLQTFQIYPMRCRTRAL